MEILTLNNLGELDGGLVGAQFDKLMHEMVRDCEMRPMLNRPRKLLVELAIVPRKNDQGYADEVEIIAKMVAKVPAREARSQSLAVCAGHGLKFNPASPDNPKQATLDELGEHEGTDE